MVIQDYSIRHKLEKLLLRQYSGLFWSYKKEKLSGLSDQIIIEKLLINGNKRDWNNLRKAYKKSSIKEVWKDQFLMGGLYPEKQKEIVKFFFGSNNPARFISDNKRRKLASSF